MVATTNRLSFHCTHLYPMRNNKYLLRVKRERENEVSKSKIDQMARSALLD